jgi:hypothetical protein
MRDNDRRAAKWTARANGAMLAALSIAILAVGLWKPLPVVAAGRPVVAAGGAVGLACSILAVWWGFRP